MAITVLFAAFTVAGCGGGDAQDGSPPASTPPSTQASSASPSPSPSPTGIARVDVDGSLIVVRKEGQRWTLWRVTPAEAVEVRLGELPFEPADAACSPDQRRIAYLKASFLSPGWRRTLAIVDVDTGRVRWPSLRGTGLHSIDGMTWLAPRKLLVSGPIPKGHVPPADDVLFLVDAATGDFTRFGDLRGTEPSAAPAAGKAAYSRLTEIGSAGPASVVREDLLLFDDSQGRESTLLSHEYTLDAARRSFARPVLAPNAANVLTAITGSDSEVIFELRQVGESRPVFRKQMSLAHPLLGAWDRRGQRVAFGGRPAIRYGRTYIWVYDVKVGGFIRSERLGKLTVVTGLSWSARGDLAASLRAISSEPAGDTVLIAPGGDPKAFTQLGAGLLPVWVE